jgi:hypothetical protein
VKRWCIALSNLHHGFLLRPWFTNVSRSLRKEPKWFLRDWADIEDPGDRAETFVGCQLLKANSSLATCATRRSARSTSSSSATANHGSSPRSSLGRHHSAIPCAIFRARRRLPSPTRWWSRPTMST